MGSSDTAVAVAVAGPVEAAGADTDRGSNTVAVVSMKSDAVGAGGMEIAEVVGVEVEPVIVRNCTLGGSDKIAVLEGQGKMNVFVVETATSAVVGEVEGVSV